MSYPKSLLVVLFIAILGIVSCFKEDKGCEPLSATEEDKRMQNFINSDSIQNFIEINELTVQHDSKGFYYIVVEPGNDQYPNVNSRVSVEYKGTLTNFTQFDKSNGIVTFPLGTLIEGWQLGLPKIGKGGRVILILPPSLAYGCSSIGVIEENSVLVFDLTLHNFQ